MWRNENKGKRREEKKEVRRMEEDKNTLGLHPEVREEDRVAKAVALFREGYNCSQSVVTAFADLYGFTREQALHMSASFGGGIGRMRETCGAACGMFLLAGLEKCAVEGKTVRARRRITLWCRNWPKNSRSGTAPCGVPICWDCPEKSR